MHRTQVLLEEHQYRRLKRESESSGRSIGELVREAIDDKYRPSQERMWAALKASRGAWADRDDIGDGAAGWCSDGRCWGHPYFSGDRAKTPAVEIWTQVIKPLLARMIG